MTINARHVKDGALIYVNGKRANGNLQFKSGENIEITLENIPDPEFIFYRYKIKEAYSVTILFFTLQKIKKQQKKLEILITQTI